METNIYLEGLEKLDNGFYRIIEKVVIPNECIDKSEIKDSSIKESIKEEYGVSPEIFYTLPIWEVTNKNKNGRSYNKVIETVVTNQEATINLADHPKGNDDGNPKETWAVGKNPRVIEGWMCADFYPVGPIGQLAVEVVDKGGPLTISSSCLGNVDSSGYVLTEGFALERYGDWVTNPSNGYKYYKNDNTKTENSNGEESIEESVTIIKEDNLEDNSIIQTKENKIMDEKLQKLQERNIEMNINSMIREAKKEEDLPSQISSLENILPYFDDGVASNLKEQVLKDIAVLKDQLTEKASKVDGLNEAVAEKDAKITELEETVKKAEEIVEKVKEKLTTADTIMEKQETKVAELEEIKKVQEVEIEELTDKVAEMMEPKDKPEDGKTSVNEPEDEEKKIDESTEESVEEASKKEADDEEKDDKEDDEEKDDSESEDDMEDEEGKEKEEACKSKKKESLSKEDKEIIFEYYKTNRKEHPELSKIRLQVYEVKSVEEAKELIDNKIKEASEEAPIIGTLRESLTARNGSGKSAVSAFKSFRG